MKLLISAAEASSDAHGAQLLHALKESAPTGESFSCGGIGGPRMRKTGFVPLMEAERLSSMGFLEIFSRIPAIFSAYFKILKFARTQRPDVAVLMDYPGFHFLVARSLHRLGIPVVYYIPPKLWAWRKSRIHQLRRWCRLVLTILPFEEDFYKKSGVTAQYVGNPLIDEMPLSLTKEQARAQLGISPQATVVTLMPGSRSAELKRHGSLFIQTARLVARELKAKAALKPQEKLVTLLPLAWGTLPGYSMASFKEDPDLDVRISAGSAHLFLAASDAGLIKSGTSTLEAALLSCPHCIVYQANWVSALIFNYLIRYSGPIGLSNLIADPRGPQARRPFRFDEVITYNVQPESLKTHLLALLTEGGRLNEARNALQLVREKVIGSGESPSRTAARAIWAVSRQRGAGFPRSLIRRVLIQVASFAWSTASWVNRAAYRFGLRKSRRLPAKVISVGNLQVGGAGKTPLVALLAREALEQGKGPCILLRGYRGSAEKSGGVIPPHAFLSPKKPSTREFGDEAVLLSQKVPEAWIGVGADRFSVFQKVRALAPGIDVVVLDDGFQHLKIARDLEIVAVTSKSADEVVFREFSCSAALADLLVWTKGEEVPFLGRFEPAVRIRFRLPQAPDGQKPIQLVSGIADPDEFFLAAKAAGYSVHGQVRLTDHAFFSRDSIEQWLRRSESEGSQLAITGKDWVKWQELAPHLSKEALVLESEIFFEKGRDFWVKTLWDGPG